MQSMPPYNSQTNQYENSIHDLPSKLATYIIGLERSYRGLPLEEKLVSAGVQFERVSGVEGTFKGQGLESYVDYEATRSIFGRDLTLGEIGCALAHQAAWSTFLDSAHEWALILEDDTDLINPKDLSSKLADLANRNENGITLLYGRGVVATSAKGNIGKDLASVHDVIIPPFSAVAYFINRRTAEMLLSLSLPLVGAADWPIRIQGTIVFRCVHPWVFVPREGEKSAVGLRPSNTMDIGKKAAYWAARLSHFHWFRHRKKYRTYRTYFHREVLSFLVRHVTEHALPYDVPAVRGQLPLAGRFSLALHRLFSPKS